MLQRIQTVWLFLAAIAIAITLYFNVYKLADGSPINLQNNYIAIVLVGISAILSMVALFSFKKRKSQLNMIWLNLLVIIGLLAWMFYSIELLKVDLNAEGGMYSFGAFVPLLSVLFLILAISGIKKDVKLLKAYDRLR